MSDVDLKPVRKTVSSWGMVQRATCDVVKPSSPEELRRVLESARGQGRKVGLRGGGNSYGDASLNQGDLLLDLTAMNGIVDWRRESGILTARPGTTIRDVWRHVVPDGYWLPVVPGTMHVTLGGAAAMNIHGKNNFKLGTIGRHIQSFDIMLADGEIRTCTREQNADLFHAAIGGFGMLGCFTSITLKMKKVHSGELEVEPHYVRDFNETIDLYEQLEPDADYLVGWHDVMAKGKSLGRGLLHRARDLRPGEDPDPERTLQLSHQHLPGRFFGVVPKSWLWMPLWFFINDPGLRFINALKAWRGRAHARGGAYRQAHAAYHFLLDYVPNWKWAYKPSGLIQFQSFVPRQHARRVFRQLVELAHRHGHPPYLCVTKRHVEDPFLMTHAVDGYSQACEYKVNRRNRDRVWAMARGMEELVLDAGGRFYFAKDSVMTPETLARAYPEENVLRFLAEKKRHDPDMLFQTDLFRRVFAGLVDFDDRPVAEAETSGAEPAHH